MCFPLDVGNLLYIRILMKMISLVDHHEQQFAVITAEITTEIGKLKHHQSGMVPPASQLTIKQNLERLFEEANETLEQIDLEARQLPDAAAKGRYQTRVKAYRTELQRLDAEMKSAMLFPNSHSNQNVNIFMNDDSNDNFYSDQRSKLLSGNSRINEQNNKLSYGRRVIEETTQIGSQALDDLGQQREAILSARERIRETDHVLGKSSNLLTRMLIRAHSHRALLICLFVIAIVTIGVTFFLVVSRRWATTNAPVSYSLSLTSEVSTTTSSTTTASLPPRNGNAAAGVATQGPSAAANGPLTDKP